jgi:hypothetical protein
MSFHYGDWQHDRLNAEKYENTKGDSTPVYTHHGSPEALAAIAAADLEQQKAAGLRHITKRRQSKTTSPARRTRARTAKRR